MPSSLELPTKRCAANTRMYIIVNLCVTFVLFYFSALPLNPFSGLGRTVQAGLMSPISSGYNSACESSEPSGIG